MSSTSAASLFGVNGLVAVITGGGTGVGLMMAQTLEENGAKVYILGRRLEVLEKAAQTAKNNNIIPLKCDVTSKTDLQSVVNHITAEDGLVNLFVANSGITGPSIKGLEPGISIADYRAALWDTDFDAFTQTFAVNTTAVFFGVVAFLELLDAGNKKGNVEQRSQVIATSSVASFSRLTLAGYAYGASKASVTHMMKTFSTMLGPYQIRSNVIAPGLYPSEMTDKLVEALKEDDGGLPYKFVPLRRPGTKEDMAGAILFLASRAGAYLNGNVVLTDGGRLGGLPSTY